MKSWVRHIFELYNLEKEFADQQVLLLWSKVVGSKLARFARAVRFSNGTLTVETASNAVSHELNLMAKLYITLLNERMNREVVRKIRFMPGSFPPRKIVNSNDLKESAIEDELPPLDTDDPHLRDSFTSLYRTQRRREEAMLRAGAHRCTRCGVVFFGQDEICPGCRYDQIDDA